MTMTVLEKIKEIIPCSVTPEILAYRTQLAQFLGKIEPTVFEANHEDTQRIRLLLGWDESTLDYFINAEYLTHSSPHAGLNVFTPNYAHPWLHQAIHDTLKKSLNTHTIHMRTMMTYNNFDDSRYRPYVWWYADINQKVQRIALFNRGKFSKKVLLSQEFTKIDTNLCTSIDKEGIRLASKAKNYAYGTVIYRSFLEQQAGLQQTNSKIEIPLDILKLFYFSLYDLTAWANIYEKTILDYYGNQALPNKPNFRQISATGELNPLLLKDFPNAKLHLIVLPNFLSIFLAYLFGLAVTTGGKKMASYFSEMSHFQKLLAQNLSIELHVPQFIGMLNTGIDDKFSKNDIMIEINPGAQKIIPFSLLLASYGDLVKTNLDTILAKDAANILIFKNIEASL